MTSGSIGSHRAFMGVSITCCVILSLTLYVGWYLYFSNLASRNAMIEMAEKAEKQVHELENLGISFDAPKIEPVPSSALPKILTASSEAPQPQPLPPLPAVPEVSPSPQTSAIPAESLYPAPSAVEKLPLQESSDEVVKAIALLDQYWKTTTWQDRLPLVANSQRVAAMMKDYYETQAGKDPVPGTLANKARYQIDGTEILYFSYNSNRPTGSLEVAMLRGPQGDFMIDWESLIGYGEMSFQDFRAQRPTKPVLMRAYVRLFEYYNYEFSDSKKYLCIKLTSENGENSVYAYCERGTKLAQWLDSDLASTGPSEFKGYTMLLSFPPEAQSSQCIRLDKVLTQRWLSMP